MQKWAPAWKKGHWHLRQFVQQKENQSTRRNLTSCSAVPGAPPQWRELNQSEEKIATDCDHDGEDYHLQGEPPFQIFRKSWAFVPIRGDQNLVKIFQNIILWKNVLLRLQSSVIHARFNKHNHNHRIIIFIIIIITITALRSRSGERCVIIRASSCHLEQMPSWQNSYMCASISIVYLCIVLYCISYLKSVCVFGISGCLVAWRSKSRPKGPKHAHRAK